MVGGGACLYAGAGQRGEWCRRRRTKRAAASATGHYVESLKGLEDLEEGREGGSSVGGFYRCKVGHGCDELHWRGWRTLSKPAEGRNGYLHRVEARMGTGPTFRYRLRRWGRPWAECWRLLSILRDTLFVGRGRKPPNRVPSVLQLKKSQLDQKVSIVDDVLEAMMKEGRRGDNNEEGKLAC